MTEREKELHDALIQTRDALLELMACSGELLNTRVAKALYKQCHEAVQTSSRLTTRPVDRAVFVKGGFDLMNM